LFAIAYFVGYFFRTANAVIAPDLSREFALSASDLGLMTSLFYAAFALVLLPVGVGLDRYGPRFITSSVMALAALGCLLFASAQSFAGLAVGRALLGAGTAGILMGALKAFGRWYPPHLHTTASGLVIGVGTVGSLMSTTPLSALNAAIGWRAVFAAGAVVIAASAGAIMLWARDNPAGATESAAPQEGGLGTVFSDIRFWRIIGLNFFMTGTQLATQSLWAGVYLYDVPKLGPLAAGQVLLWMALGVVIGSIGSGRLAGHWGVARVIIAAAAIFIVSQGALALIPPQGWLRPVYFVFGATGVVGTMLLAQTRFIFPPSLSGRGVTAVNVFGLTGTFVLQWLMGVVVGGFPTDAHGHYPPQAYSLAFAITALGTLVTLLWYLPMMRTNELHSSHSEG
jgi:predicted MFS family arabinose efflux permease